MAPVAPPETAMQFGVQFFPALSPRDRDPAGYFADCLAIAILLRVDYENRRLLRGFAV